MWFLISLFTFLLQMFHIEAIPTTNILGNTESRHNNFACTSPHPPVILLHGLSGNPTNLEPLSNYLTTQGFCTYSMLYGAMPLSGGTGGLAPVNSSAYEIAGWIHEVLANSTAKKVNLVGHSEGALQSLYLPKFAIDPIKIDKVVAIAPGTHGTTLSNIYGIPHALGLGFLLDLILNVFGCPGCTDLLVGSELIKRLNAGPISQAQIQYTIIASVDDEIVTPAPQASFAHERNIANVLLQDICPDRQNSRVNHFDEPNDINVQGIVLNALLGKAANAIQCT